MREPLYIYGAGGLGKEVLSLANATDSYEVKGFFDDGLSRSPRREIDDSGLDVRDQCHLLRCDAFTVGGDCAPTTFR